MLHLLAKLFRNEAPLIAPFIDASLGKFDFEPDIGWKTQVQLGERKVELVLGSDGEPPSEKMLEMAKAWVGERPCRYPQIIDYIRMQLQRWPTPVSLLSPDRFEVESINLLWSDKPTTCMVYFNYPGDEFRLWHVTFDGFDPRVCIR